MQFFGDKYGRRYGSFKLGAIMGSSTAISMELCAGPTHASTGEIGLFRIEAEGAIAQACAASKRWPD
jgi:alanyl-tRNA synthetase